MHKIYHIKRKEKAAFLDLLHLLQLYHVIKISPISDPNTYTSTPDCYTVYLLDHETFAVVISHHTYFLQMNKT